MASNIKIDVENDDDLHLTNCQNWGKKMKKETLCEVVEPSRWQIGPPLHSPRAPTMRADR
jgi:hypothetical protein